MHLGLGVRTRARVAEHLDRRRSGSFAGQDQTRRMTMGIDAILFDIDGTLVDSNDYHVLA